MSMNSATEYSFNSMLAACMLAVGIVSKCVVDLRFMNPNWYVGMRTPIAASIRPLIIVVCVWLRQRDYYSSFPLLQEVVVSHAVVVQF